jgi:hypothetical protein
VRPLVKSWRCFGTNSNTACIPCMDVFDAQHMAAKRAALMERESVLQMRDLHQSFGIAGLPLHFATGFLGTCNNTCCQTPVSTCLRHDSFLMLVFAFMCVTIRQQQQTSSIAATVVAVLLVPCAPFCPPIPTALGCVP